MTDSPAEPRERDDDEHPLESEDALREPRDESGEEQDRAPQPGVVPEPQDD